MKIKVNCNIYIDVDVSKPYFLNSDTIEDYKDDLLSKMCNTSLDKIWENPIYKIGEELEIISVAPYDDGCDEFENILNDWKKHYDNRLYHLKIK